MSESVRTLVYVGVAVVVSGLAVWTNHAYTPQVAEGFAKIGKPFYPEFDNPTAAYALEIVGYDEDDRESQLFRVEYDKGSWQIPSHHNYPADATQLKPVDEDDPSAEPESVPRVHVVAASLIGIEREALAGRLAASHRRYGVVDPETDDSTLLEGHGQRIRVLDENDEVLADYIIGKRVADRDGLYYVRKPDETETYMVSLELDVSTKFAEWIEPDLLKLKRNEVLSLARITPKIREAVTPLGVMQQVVGETRVELNRPESSGDWTIDGLDAEKEELDTSVISQTLTALDGMQLVGVRPKPPGLTEDLTIDPAIFRPGMSNRELQSQFERLGLSLRNAGLQLIQITGAPGEPNPLEFVLKGEGGDFNVTTETGLRYTLHFGTSISGGAKEIEVGDTGTAAVVDENAPDAGESQTETKDENSKQNSESAKSDSESPSADEEKSSGQLARFLFVRVQFDESLIPNQPQKPQPPEPIDPHSVPATAQKPNQPLVEPGGISPTAQSAYEAELQQYQTDLKQFEETVAEGRQKAKELNERFAPWYYLVAAESYQKLKLSREELVKEKQDEKPQPSPPRGGPGRPQGLNGLNIPGFNPGAPR